LAGSATVFWFGHGYAQDQPVGRQDLIRRAREQDTAAAGKTDGEVIEDAPTVYLGDRALDEEPSPIPRRMRRPSSSTGSAINSSGDISNQG
jgi:hypothetical protein